jgi:hypothetical protein
MPSSFGPGKISLLTSGRPPNSFLAIRAVPHHPACLLRALIQSLEYRMNDNHRSNLPDS